MIKVIKHENMGRSDRGWLHSLFHFSFAEYYKPDNIKFGALRVVNDDRFDPHGGFGMHPHDNMEWTASSRTATTWATGAASSGATCST